MAKITKEYQDGNILYAEDMTEVKTSVNELYDIIEWENLTEPEGE